VTGQSPLPGVASWGGAESVAKNSTTEYTTQINPVCTCDGHAAVALPEDLCLDVEAACPECCLPLADYSGT
jgi:hypothetical protein